MQSNVAEIISEWLEEKLDLPFTIYNDLIVNAENDGACIRHDPAPAAERRYNDGTRFVAWNFSFYVRCKKAAEARGIAKQIIDELDGACITANDTEFTCEAVTLPQFLNTDEKGFTTYTASVRVMYLEADHN